MRWRSLVVVALVVLAGCNGALDGGDESTATVTPIAVPTDQATPTALPTLAPGLTRRGIEDPDALLAAHESTLENRSFTTRSNTTLTFANGSTVPGGSSVTYAGAAGETVRVVVDRPETGDAVPTHTEAWQRDTALFVNRTDANGTTDYDRITVGSGQRIGVYGAGNLEYRFRSLALAGTSVIERERNGTTVFDVRGSVAGETMDDATFRLVVGQDGLIHRYRVTQETFSGNQSATTTTVVTYDDVGTTPPPERPDWVDVARNRTTATSDRPTELATTNATETTTGAKPTAT